MKSETPLPLHGGKWLRQEPLRLVLLACYTATHGSGCPLQQRSGGILTLDFRSTVAVKLWRKLTGDETTPKEKLLAEASAAHRKNSTSSTPSASFRRWLSSPVGASGATGFGSNSERIVQPEVKGMAIDAPAPGAYNPAEIMSQASTGSTWSRISTTTSRRPKADGTEDQGQRDLPWDAKDVTPANVDYRTSCRNMANEAAKHAGRVSPGMTRPTAASRLLHVQHVNAKPAGPGSYDVGGFNMSRNDRSRPSSAFASKAPRPSPFGGTPLVANANLRDMWREAYGTDPPEL